MEKHIYSRLSAQESEEFLVSSPQKLRGYYENSGSTISLRIFLPWLIHALLILSYATVGIIWPLWRRMPEFDVASSRIPIEHQTIQFFDGVQNVSEYQGPSNPKTDKMWADLIDAGGGVLLIDEEIAKNLPTETARAPGSDAYTGAMEVFHQLHCLNRIRKLYYDHTRNNYNESAVLFRYHTEHCFDYLRQTLMCHGDVGFMSMDYDEEHDDYYAKFGVVKQCRNFDKIREWAKEHQYRL